MCGKCECVGVCVWSLCAVCRSVWMLVDKCECVDVCVELMLVEKCVSV